MTTEAVADTTDDAEADLEAVADGTDSADAEADLEADLEADDSAEAGDGADLEADDDRDTFPREYVEQLRGEARRHRQAARDAQRQVADLEAEVWRMRVTSTGRLADPSDLPIPEDRLDADVDAEVAALLAAKPHLAARRAGGRIGQGEPSTPAAPGLADMLRAGA